MLHGRPQRGQREGLPPCLSKNRVLRGLFRDYVFLLDVFEYFLESSPPPPPPGGALSVSFTPKDETLQNTKT